MKYMLFSSMLLKTYNINEDLKVVLILCTVVFFLLYTCVVLVPDYKKLPFDIELEN